MTTSYHEIGASQRRQGAIEQQPIRVGAGTWIGTRAVVLPGVTIGPGCVIAAGAVVTKDCEANGLYMGLPAVRVRDLS
jgi:acetyltransferase-like isoleucine patch superfamily enzyme